MSTNLTITTATLLQLEFLARLTGRPVDDLLAQAVHDFQVVAIFRAAQTASGEAVTLADLVAALHPARPSQEAQEALTVAPPTSPPPAPAVAPRSVPGAVAAPAAPEPYVPADAEEEMILTYAALMTTDFASRGLVQVIAKNESTELDAVKVGKILSRAGWPQRPLAANTPAVWLAKKPAPTNGLQH